MDGNGEGVEKVWMVMGRGWRKEGLGGGGGDEGI